MSEAPISSPEPAKDSKNKTKKIGKAALQVVPEVVPPATQPPDSKRMQTVRVGNAKVLISYEIPMKPSTHASRRKGHRAIFRGFTDPKRHG